MTGRIVGRHRFIPIHEICSAIGSPVCEILPAVHAITGCYTISSLYFMGKKSVMKLVSAKCHEFQDMRALGGESEEFAIQAARKLIVALYDPKEKYRKPTLENLNDLRVRMVERNDQPLSRLPPCEASFLQHGRRAQWQTKIWMSSDQAFPAAYIESPIGHGWCREMRKLVQFSLRVKWLLTYLMTWCVPAKARTSVPKL